MSVVLVVFPGAPQVSPEAQAKDAQLDQTIETKITGISTSCPYHRRMTHC
jgi:hypothetical protein